MFIFLLSSEPCRAALKHAQDSKPPIKSQPALSGPHPFHTPSCASRPPPLQASTRKCGDRCHGLPPHSSTCSLWLLSPHHSTPSLPSPATPEAWDTAGYSSSSALRHPLSWYASSNSRTTTDPSQTHACGALLPGSFLVLPPGGDFPGPVLEVAWKLHSCSALTWEGSCPLTYVQQR